MCVCVYMFFTSKIKLSFQKRFFTCETHPVAPSVWTVPWPMALSASGGS